MSLVCALQSVWFEGAHHWVWFEECTPLSVVWRSALHSVWFGECTPLSVVWRSALHQEWFEQCTPPKVAWGVHSTECGFGSALHWVWFGGLHSIDCGWGVHSTQYNIWLGGLTHSVWLGGLSQSDVPGAIIAPVTCLIQDCIHEEAGGFRTKWERQGDSVHANTQARWDALYQGKQYA